MTSPPPNSTGMVAVSSGEPKPRSAWCLLQEHPNQQYYLASEMEDALCSAIGSCRFLDPPDGGDVPLIEQVRRMRASLECIERAYDAVVRERDGLREALAEFMEQTDAPLTPRGLEDVIDIYRERFRAALSPGKQP